jgi:hypothetical protein
VGLVPTLRAVPSPGVRRLAPDDAGGVRSVLRTIADKTIKGGPMSIKERITRHNANHIRVVTWWAHADHDELLTKVTACGVAKSKYIRAAVLGHKIKSQGEAQLAAALAKLGGLQVRLNQDLREAVGEGKESAAIIADHNRLYREIHETLVAIRDKSRE